MTTTVAAAAGMVELGASTDLLLQDGNHLHLNVLSVSTLIYFDLH
jgi:hypothetical protein